MSSERISAEARRTQILNTGEALCSTGVSLPELLPGDIAHELGISRSLVFHHFPSTALLREAVLSEAITGENVEIVRQALVEGMPAAKRAPWSLRKRALEMQMAQMHETWLQEDEQCE